MDFHKVFNFLVEKRELSIRSLTEDTYENLRVRLVKAFSRHKKFLDETGLDDGDCALSVSGRFDRGTGLASFSIRERQKKTSPDFEVVEELSDAKNNTNANT